MNLRLLFLVVFDIRWLQLCLELFAGFNFVVFYIRWIQLPVCLFACSLLIYDFLALV